MLTKEVSKRILNISATSAMNGAGITIEGLIEETAKVYENEPLSVLRYLNYRRKLLKLSRPDRLTDEHRAKYIRQVREYRAEYGDKAPLESRNISCSIGELEGYVDIAALIEHFLNFIARANTWNNDGQGVRMTKRTLPYNFNVSKHCFDPKKGFNGETVEFHTEY